MRPTSMLVACLGFLALACGGGPTSPAAGEAPSPGSTGPTTPEAAPASASTAQAAPAVDSWPASIQGVCEMQAACGCAEKPTVDACVASLQVNAVVFTPDVLSCIVTQPCATMCSGGGVQCVNDGAARQSAAERARHETTMQVIDNFPTGGPCAAGQTEVQDASGAFVRCQ